MVNIGGLVAPQARPYVGISTPSKASGMIGRLNHIAIAVPDLGAAVTQYREAFGASVTAPEDLPDHGVTVAFAALPNTNVELIHPLGDDSPIADFLARAPSGGLHHVCYEVADLGAAADRLANGGARILGPARTGAHGRQVLFLHPKDFQGCLIELEEV